MRTMQVVQPGKPLDAVDMPTPIPGPNQVLLRVRACGVCRTDPHVADGDLTEGKLPVVPGHEIVGIVAAVGKAVRTLKEGQRVGIGYQRDSCGHCEWWVRGEENLAYRDPHAHEPPQPECLQPVGRRSRARAASYV